VEPKLLPETSQHGQGEVGVGDGIANVGEVIGDCLQARDVVGDRQLPMGRVAELLLRKTYWDAWLA
jgi:hypothetical protein